MNELQWRRRILEAIEEDRTAMPSRNGGTPLSDLLESIEAPDGGVDEWTAIISALANLTLDDAAATESEDYWNGLMIAAQALAKLRSPMLQAAFLQRLSDPELQRRRLEVYPLQGYVAAGGKLMPVELQELSGVRERAPLAWLNAAVMSGHFDLAKRELEASMQAGRLHLPSLLLSLEDWAAHWRQGEDFGDVVHRLLQVAPSSGHRQELENWLRDFGYTTASVTPTQDDSPRDFLREIEEYAKGVGSSDWPPPLVSNSNLPAYAAR